MINVPAIPCQHIADYYFHKQMINPCIGYALLSRGYSQWSIGTIESYFNNLFRPIISLRR